MIAVALAARRHGDHAAVRGVLDRVFEQLAEDDLDRARVAECVGRSGAMSSTNSWPAGDVREPRHRGAQHAAEIERTAWLGVGAARPAREPSSSCSTRAASARVRSAMRSTDPRRSSSVMFSQWVSKRRGVSLDDGDRRPQFVARHRKEQVLALLDRLRPADVAEVDDGLAGVGDRRDTAPRASGPTAAGARRPHRVRAPGTAMAARALRPATARSARARRGSIAAPSPSASSTAMPSRVASTTARSCSRCRRVRSYARAFARAAPAASPRSSSTPSSARPIARRSCGEQHVQRSGRQPVEAGQPDREPGQAVRSCRATSVEVFG